MSRRAWILVSMLTACVVSVGQADWWMGHRLHDPERSVGLFPSSYVHVT